jgi:hypothetical protein
MSDAIDGELTEGRALALAQDRSLAARPVAESMPTLFGAMRPSDKIAYAVEVANALKPILEAKKLVHKLNRRNPDDEYVELEGWQTCANLCGVTAKVEWTKPLEDGSGFESRAVVVRVESGIEVAAGESQCSRKEGGNWGNAQDFALKGMAQTRAQSRALRGVLAWILVLAGYNPTPAEEMPPPIAPTVRGVKPAELADLAKERGINLGQFLEDLFPGFAGREKRALLPSESVQARDALLDFPKKTAASTGTAIPSAPTSGQKGMLFALCSELGVDDNRRHELYYEISGKGRWADLTRDDARKVIDHLTSCKENGNKP